MDFNIGDAVRIKETGAIDKITDKLFSEAVGQMLYSIEGDFDLYGVTDLEPAPKPSCKLYYTIEKHENLVMAVLYDDGKELACGYGHILHSGTVGYAQAASYALKKIYESLNGGKMFRFGEGAGHE